MRMDNFSTIGRESIKDSFVTRNTHSENTSRKMARYAAMSAGRSVLCILGLGEYPAHFRGDEIIIFRCFTQLTSQATRLSGKR